MDQMDGTYCTPTSVKHSDGPWCCGTTSRLATLNDDTIFKAQHPEYMNGITNT